jgi:sugar phosphate isomerase/epimerase
MDNSDRGHDKSQMRIGTLVYGASALTSVPALLPDGFESFGLTFWQTTGGLDLKDCGQRLAELLAPSQATVSSLAIFGNPLLPPGGDNADSLASWRRLIEHAADFGCDLVTGFTGRLPGLPIEASLPSYAKVFGELAARAADHGVRLAFEHCSMGGSWQSGDWNIAHNPAAWSLMWDVLPADNLGLQWEPCHQLLALIDPLPQLQNWVGQVFHVHGKDANIDWQVIRQDGVFGRRAFAQQRTAGYGDSDWTAIIKVLQQAGYQGSIDIEGFHDPIYRDELELVGQRHALGYLKDCRAKAMAEHILSSP